MVHSILARETGGGRGGRRGRGGGGGGLRLPASQARSQFDKL